MALQEQPVPPDRKGRRDPRDRRGRRGLKAFLEPRRVDREEVAARPGAAARAAAFLR